MADTRDSRQYPVVDDRGVSWIVKQTLMEAINEFANSEGQLFASQSELADYLSDMGFLVRYADGCNECELRTVWPARGTLVRYEGPLDIDTASFACDYICPRCSNIWMTWWAWEDP